MDRGGSGLSKHAKTLNSLTSWEIYFWFAQGRLPSGDFQADAQTTVDVEDWWPKQPSSSSPWERKLTIILNIKSQSVTIGEGGNVDWLVNQQLCFYNELALYHNRTASLSLPFLSHLVHEQFSEVLKLICSETDPWSWVDTGEATSHSCCSTLCSPPDDTNRTTSSAKNR